MYLQANHLTELLSVTRQTENNLTVTFGACVTMATVEDSLKGTLLLLPCLHVLYVLFNSACMLIAEVLRCGLCLSAVRRSDFGVIFFYKMLIGVHIFIFTSYWKMKTSVVEQ